MNRLIVTLRGLCQVGSLYRENQDNTFRIQMFYFSTLFQIFQRQTRNLLKIRISIWQMYIICSNSMNRDIHTNKWSYKSIQKNSFFLILFSLRNHSLIKRKHFGYTFPGNRKCATPLSFIVKYFVVKAGLFASFLSVSNSCFVCVSNPKL